jgi:hypothetical protein
MSTYNYKFNYKFYFSHSGLILIELLITMSISLLLLSNLMGIYLTCMHSLQFQFALYSIEDNARTAISILNSSLHEAGHIGCAKLSKDFPIVSYHDYSLNSSNKIIGNNLNEITVRNALYPHATLIQTLKNNESLYADKEVHFKPGNIVIIANCKRAEIFEIKEINLYKDKQRITPTSPLHFQYEKFSEISHLAINRYFIAKTKRKNRDGSAIHALFLQDINQYKTELVADIESMKLSYTVNLRGQLRELSADKIVDWSEVKGVAIDFNLYTPPLKKTWHAYAVLENN